jgi:hypothetical protein
MVEETYDYKGTTLAVGMHLIKLGFVYQAEESMESKLIKGDCEVTVEPVAIETFCCSCNPYPEKVQRIHYVGDAKTLDKIQERLTPYKENMLMVV